MKTIAVLGATGSVGLQALDVARQRGYRVDFLSANKDFKSLESLAREFKPREVALADARAASSLRTALADTDIKVLAGKGGIEQGIHNSESEVVINSILGEAGLMPTLAVIDSGKRLALANKESLVIAGDIVMARARERGVEILPVDSEHSAIFQSLRGENYDKIQRIILTASGGPFYNKSREEQRSLTLEDTLAHPTWKMGKKITVDSATLMNKGFEIIEAAHLFGVGEEKIEVVIHRESILHSAVEYLDNAIIAQLSPPDMRMCVQYAVDYPERFSSMGARLDFFSLGKMTFAAPDTVAFPLLSLARRACRDGGAMGAVLNAADEEVVSSFLSGEISFYDISELVYRVYDKLSSGNNVREMSGILTLASEARKIAKAYIKEKK